MKQEDYNKCLDELIEFHNTAEYAYNEFSENILEALKYTCIPEERTFKRLCDLCNFPLLYDEPEDHQLTIENMNILYQKAKEIMKECYPDCGIDFNSLQEKITEEDIKDGSFYYADFIRKNIKMRDRDLLGARICST